MKTTYKRMSHSERLSNPSNYPQYKTNLVGSVEVLSTEQVSVDGTLHLQSVKKVLDPRDNFKDVKASDFALSNLIAVGAVDQLRPVQLGAQNNLGYMDNLVDAVGVLGDAVGNESLAAETIVESQTPSENG